MTPEQALQVLVQLAALGHAPKNDHVMAEQAAQVLQGVLAAQAEPEDQDNADANGQLEERHATQP